MKILVISPHPDDLDFACAGTVARLVGEGHEVSYVIVSDGSKGTRGVPEGKNIGEAELIELRKREQREAARVVGVEDVTFLGFKDGEIEDTPKLREELVKQIRRFKPDIVFSFDPAPSFDSFFRAHRDHRMVAVAVFDAIYPASHNRLYFPHLLEQGYEPHRIGEAWFFSTVNPDRFIDITETMEKKIAALACHRSQLRDMERIAELVKERAREWGEVGGYRYAEAFRRVEMHR
ncbi:MAG: PIG-L deacetylase family protein [Candidatus Bipolaricaulia bacterium]